MFQGIFVATATPFTAQGLFDDRAYQKHIERLIAAGVHGLVPAGTTGECPTLDDAEKRVMFGICVEAAQGRAKVVAGAGTNSTAKSVAAAELAAECGVDGVLVVNPYYNKPTQAGLIAHFQAVADVGVPVMIYNIPGRTAINATPETILAAARHPKIVAVKEASGAIGPTIDIKRQNPELNVLAGDDALFLPNLAVGGDGVVSVAANVAPELMVALWDAWHAAAPAKAREINLRLWPLMRTLFVETNPIPVKAALTLLGQFGPEVRLPLTPAVEATIAQLRAVLAELGLLEVAS